MYKKILAILLSVSLVASLFCGCAKTEVAETNVQSGAQSETKSEESKVIMRSGNLVSMNSDFEVEEQDERFPIYFYDDLNSLILAFKSDKIDSIYMLPEAVARYIENNVDDVKAVEPSIYNGTISLSMGTLKGNDEVYNLLNDAIDKLINNGTILKLQDEYLDKYLRTKEEPKPVDMQKKRRCKNT